jgi:hypothetical protein
MAKLNWEKASSQARFNQFRGAGQTDTIRDQEPKDNKTKSRTALAMRMCDRLEGGLVSDNDYQVLLRAADQLSKGNAMTPKQSGVWSKYAKAAN